jgi:hypothetical protein
MVQITSMIHPSFCLLKLSKPATPDFQVPVADANTIFNNTIFKMYFRLKGHRGLRIIPLGMKPIPVLFLPDIWSAGFPTNPGPDTRMDIR